MIDPVYRYDVFSAYFKCRQAALAAVMLLISLSVSGDSMAQTMDTVTVSPGKIADTVNDAGIRDSSGKSDTDTVVPDSVVFRAVQDSIVTAYKKDRNFAYANDSDYWINHPEKAENNFFDFLFRGLASAWVRWLIYALLMGVLLFALYKIIVVNKLYLFYTSPKRQKPVKVDDVDIHDEDFEDKIKEAEQQQHYRLAIRYRYLKTLRLLDNKGLIRFHPRATNREYLNQLAGKREAKDFGLLTHLYEYVWYGEFAVSPEQFVSIRQHFDHFYNTAGS